MNKNNDASQFDSKLFIHLTGMKVVYYLEIHLFDLENNVKVYFMKLHTSYRHKKTVLILKVLKMIKY